MAKAVQPQKIRFSQAIQTPLYKNLVNNTLGDPVRAGRFIANITSAVAVNAELQKCDPGTILAGALLGESLLLQPSPQLGQFYLVPFKSKAKYDREGQMIEPEKFKAQFVLGYKGYIQLALRTGQYKRLNVLEVKNGELSGWDPFEERFHEMHFIEDFEKRMSMPTIGYMPLLRRWMQAWKLAALHGPPATKQPGRSPRPIPSPYRRPRSWMQQHARPVCCRK